MIQWKIASGHLPAPVTATRMAGFPIVSGPLVVGGPTPLVSRFGDGRIVLGEDLATDAERPHPGGNAAIDCSLHQ